MRLKEIIADERPRERLVRKGPHALSNAELIAIIMRTGTGDRNVIEIANDLLRSAGYSLTRLSAGSIESMTEIKGIGIEKATAIMAAFEIGRRFALEKTGTDDLPVTNAVMVYEMMIPELKGLEHEECWVIYLNRGNMVIGKEKVGSGGLDSITFDNDTDRVYRGLCGRSVHLHLLFQRERIQGRRHGRIENSRGGFGRGLSAVSFCAAAGGGSVLQRSQRDNGGHERRMLCSVARFLRPVHHVRQAGFQEYGNRQRRLVAKTESGVHVPAAGGCFLHENGELIGETNRNREAESAIRTAFLLSFLHVLQETIRLNS